MLNWKKMINDHNKEFNGKCIERELNDSNIESIELVDKE